jgi:hypothetical protein
MAPSRPRSLSIAEKVRNKTEGTVIFKPVSARGRKRTALTPARAPTQRGELP